MAMQIKLRNLFPAQQDADRTFFLDQRTQQVAGKSVLYEADAESGLRSNSILIIIVCLATIELQLDSENSSKPW